MSFQLCYFI